MKSFKKVVTTQVVQYNSDNPDKQLVEKEDITTTIYKFWGLIRIEDIKDIKQIFKQDSKKGVGF